MDIKVTHVFYSFILAVLAMTAGCTGSPEEAPAAGEEQAVQSKRSGINEVIVHELSDPDKLNPSISTSANATYIEYNIFMYLIDIDKETLDLVPSLARQRPRITEVTEGEYKDGLKIEYEIRPEAVWDDGQPVTGHDVAFTYKSIKNPLTDAENLRPYIEFIDHIVVDEADPKKFTLYCKEKYFMAEFTSGNAYILPEHIYDPKGLMKGFSIKELNDVKKRDELRSDPKVIEFAADFNSEKYQREVVVGCGPYQYEEWTTSQRIVLTKKKDWWGEQFAGVVPGFAAYPDKITYEIINDWTTAITALKDEGLDVARSIRPKDFKDLQENESFQQKYHTFTPLEFSYTYIGMHTRNPKLADKRVRQALSHIVNKQQTIDVLMYGFAKPTIGPFNPVKPYYNEEIEDYEFNLEKAAALLDEAGWVDTDANGIRDKVIDGRKMELKLTFKYNSGNDVREKVGLFFKENARKVGVDIEILAREWTVYLDEVRKMHDFELCCLGWVQDPIIDDPKQIWHTQSYDGGGNYVGFGNAKTDALIESIRYEMDEGKREPLYMELQEIIHEEAPYIFLYSPQGRLVMHKRYKNAEAYMARPGYTERNLNVTPLPTASAE